MTSAVRSVYCALWATTTLGALITVATGLSVIQVGVPRDALPANAATAVDLLAHNVVVALWPLALAALGWTGSAVARAAGDALVAGQIALHGLLVGSAFGQQPGLWRFLPHLPLEWLGIAVPAAGWFLSRQTTLGARRIAEFATASVLALVAAALLETWAVPL